jgi:hypothetical protein
MEKGFWQKGNQWEGLLLVYDWNMSKDEAFGHSMIKLKNKRTGTKPEEIKKASWTIGNSENLLWLFQMTWKFYKTILMELGYQTQVHVSWTLMNLKDRGAEWQRSWTLPKYEGGGKCYMFQKFLRRSLSNWRTCRLTWLAYMIKIFF